MIRNTTKSVLSQYLHKGRIILFFDLQDFFFRFRVGGGGGGGGRTGKKALKMTPVDWSFSELLFFNIFRTNRKTSKVNQQSVLNL